MKLASFRYNGTDSVGVLSSDETKIYPFKDIKDMNEFIDECAGNSKILAETREKLVKLEADRNVGIPLSNVQLLAPIPVPKQDVICLGINYALHAQESAKFSADNFKIEKSYPVYFSKRVNEAVPHGGVIHIDENVVTALDYEVELAAIIGKDAKNVAPEDAYDYVFGYTILNDVTDRTAQTNHTQWYFGKSFDDFTPMGPYIVTEDCFERPPILKIQASVNDEIRQDATTDQLIYDLSYIISDLSAGMTLKAGTVIATGTPAGVGMGFKPPKFLKKGDKIVCTVEGIGSLENTIG